jgi:hypothetical protein
MDIDDRQIRRLLWEAQMIASLTPAHGVAHQAVRAHRNDEPETNQIRSQGGTNI